MRVGCGSESSNFIFLDTPDQQESVSSSLLRNKNPEPLTGDLETLVAGNHKFALDMYKQLDTNSSNFMLSPFSIRLAFGLLQAGTRGDTEAEIAPTLHYGLTGDALHATFNALDLALAKRNIPRDPENDPVELKVANSFWGLNGFPWEKTYLDLIAENYGAGIKILDFKNEPEKSRTTINDWVEERTQKKIKNLLPEGSVNPDETVSVLVNAFYFKAPWAVRFNPDRTTEANFDTLNNSTVQADFMHQVGTFNYTDSVGFQALEMLFRTGDLSMVLLLPDLDTFDDFENNLDTNQLGNILSGLGRALGTLSIPKFEFEAGFELKKILENLGMTTVFQDIADLSGMASDNRLFVDDVYHKTFISIDEEGAEAAAATGIVASVSSAPSRSFELTADHPFLFLIRDRVTGTILFMGRVTDPTN